MTKKRMTLKRALFNPDNIVTTISQLLNRDLSQPHTVYGRSNLIQRFYRDAQKEATLKKYVSFEANMDGVEEKTYKDFLATNDRIKKVNQDFSWPRSIPSRHLSPIELALNRARALVHWTLRDCSWGELFDELSHSGGVTVGVSFADTSVDRKFTWPISATAEAAEIMEEFLSESELLKDAIKKLNSHQPVVERYSIVEGSRATTVPKTKDKLRMIAVEPTANMFIQQGVMRMMYRRLASVGLDVESLPSEHKMLARVGSITGKLATIDFSSASDSVSIELLRFLLPSEWFDLVDRIRCPTMKIAGENIDVHMISTMGNAGTFPLETLVFWSLGVAAVMNRDRENPNSLLSLPEERRAVSVFGDDCILPTDCASFFKELCTHVGFQVNEEKSFTDEECHFRESCGGDYLHGLNVRPVYIQAPTSRRKSALEPWLYTILNGILKKYESYFGSLRYVYEKELLAYLFSIFEKERLLVKLVPSYFPDDSGLKTEDWKRLRACYGFKMSTVKCSDQGLYSFKYLRFSYEDRREPNEYLRYATWLHKPSRQRPRVLKRLEDRDKDYRKYPVRKKGGYVVAKGLSSCWSL